MSALRASERREIEQSKRDRERIDALRAQAPNACALAETLRDAIDGRGVGSIALAARLVCVDYMANHGQEIPPDSPFERSTVELLGKAIQDHGARS